MSAKSRSSTSKLHSSPDAGDIPSPDPKAVPEADDDPAFDRNADPEADPGDLKADPEEADPETDPGALAGGAGVGPGLIPDAADMFQCRQVVAAELVADPRVRFWYYIRGSGSRQLNDIN
jgi:hypothetical protein